MDGQVYNERMKLRVLIADDALFIHEVLKHHLSQYDVEIVGNAYTGSEAVSLALQTRPDLIFMDMAMPELNGINAAKKIFQLFPKTQIIAISSMANESLVAEAISVGCVDFIEKSFPIAQLQDAIQSVRSRIFSMQIKAKDVVNG